MAYVQHVSGNKHDVNGLYALLHTTFKGALLGDSAYQPNPTMNEKLHAQGIRAHAEQKANAKEPRPEYLRQWLHVRRSPIERHIALFNEQFAAGRTLNRSVRHFLARRWTKALAHNCSRYINLANQLPVASVRHFHAAA